MYDYHFTAKEYAEYNLTRWISACCATGSAFSGSADLCLALCRADHHAHPGHLCDDHSYPPYPCYHIFSHGPCPCCLLDPAGQGPSGAVGPCWTPWACGPLPQRDGRPGHDACPWSPSCDWAPCCLFAVRHYGRRIWFVHSFRGCAPVVQRCWRSELDSCFCSCCGETLSDPCDPCGPSRLAMKQTLVQAPIQELKRKCSQRVQRPTGRCLPSQTPTFVPACLLGGPPPQQH